MSNSAATPPPIPPRRHDPLPTPLAYAHGDLIPRWSPWPLTIAGAIYAVFVTAAAGLACRFELFFRDFKVNPPPGMPLLLAIANLIWRDHGWVILLILLPLLPAVTIRFVPAPLQPESRRRIARTVRLLIALLFLGTAIASLLSVLGPMIGLIQSMSKP